MCGSHNRMDDNRIVAFKEKSYRGLKLTGRNIRLGNYNRLGGIVFIFHHLSYPSWSIIDAAAEQTRQAIP